MSETLGIRASLDPSQTQIFDQEANLAQQVHNELAGIADETFRDVWNTPARILVINTVRTHPLEDRSFKDLPLELQALNLRAHLGSTDPSSTENRPISYPNKLTWAIGLEPGDPEILVWDLAWEDEDRPQFEDFAELVRACDAALITGSDLMINEVDDGGMTHPEMFRFMRLNKFLTAWKRFQLLKAEYNRPVSPLVGICFGHQAIARLMGRRETIGPAEAPGSGIVTAALTPEARKHTLLSTLGETATFAQSRSLGVRQKPSDAKVVGHTPNDPNNMLVYSSIPGMVTLEDHPDLWALSLESMRRIRGKQPNSLDLSGYDPGALAQTRLKIFTQFLREAGRSQKFRRQNHPETWSFPGKREPQYF